MNAIEVLGLFIQVEKWNKAKKLPLYITYNFKIQKAIINGIQCLALNPQNELPNLSALKKQIKKIQEVEPLPVFLNLKTLSVYRKESLVKNGIPFVLLDKMVYLPFLGTLLTDAHLCSEKVNDRLTMSAQLLFIWIIYQRAHLFYISDAIEKLHFSNMTITRAYRQLLSTGLFEEQKDGRKIYLMSNNAKRELFKGMRPYLRTPIRSYGYIEKAAVNDKMIESGESALSRYSLLSTPSVTTYAIHKANVNNLSVQGELVDIDKQVILEVWDHDPFLFARENKIIDPLSLVISLLTSEDERVEMERDRLLDSIFDEKGETLWLV